MATSILNNSQNITHKKIMIRNSTVEFLIFTSDTRTENIEVMYADKMIWLTQKLMGELFEVTTSAINQHLKTIFTDGELEEKQTIKKFLIVQKEGKKDVERKIDYYNLDVIISVGYRVNSDRAISFRKWATRVLSEFAQKGYILDNKRLKTWNLAPQGKILKTDVVVAKNYLEKEELENLNRIVTMYLDHAEDQAKRKIPMTMEDWIIRLNEFLKFNRRDVLQNAGKVAADVAKSFAESEFEKYRAIQDKSHESDFDKFLTDTKKSKKIKQ